MTKPITIQDAEITIVGITFKVSYRYVAGHPATYWQSADPAEVDILNVSVLGQPTANADELLEAIKIGLTGSTTYKYGIQFDNGYDLLEQYIKISHEAT